MVVGSDSAPAGPPARVASGWDERAGPVLLVAGESSGEAFVVYPQLQGDAGPDTLDVTDYTGATATLIARRGTVGTVELGGSAPEPEEPTCTPWPRVTIPANTPPWTVGFLRSSVEVVPVDSLHAMPARDSARFVAGIARLASTLAGSRQGENAERFHGLPFVVKDAATFTQGEQRVAVAHVIRRVHLEATPLEEHTLLILERPVTGQQWSVAYAEHAVGPEDSVVREELLGVVRLGKQPTLILVLDSGEGVSYALVQRSESGRWRRVWRSALPAC